MPVLPTSDYLLLRPKRLLAIKHTIKHTTTAEIEEIVEIAVKSGVGVVDAARKTRAEPFI